MGNLSSVGVYLVGLHKDLMLFYCLIDDIKENIKQLPTQSVRDNDSRGKK